jgi:micrococcal nuclease
MYEYRATINSVYDGDTVTATIYLGFLVTVTEKFRLLGINAPELKKGDNREAGKAARDYLASLIEGKEVIMRTEKTQEKYGRWLSTILLDGVDINAEMVKAGHAVPFMVERV